ncbi:MAG: hypothetical protein ACI4KF_09875 [Huintestinicola sp.]
MLQIKHHGRSGKAYIKRSLSSVLAVCSVLAFSSGCSSDDNTGFLGYSKEPEGYNSFLAQRPVKDIEFGTNVISFAKDYDPAMNYNGAFEITDAAVYDSKLLVAYSFTNTDSLPSAAWEFGHVNAYQCGIELDGTSVGELDEYTKITAGSTVYLMKQFDLKNTVDSVSVMAEGFSSVCDHRIVSLGITANEVFLTDIDETQNTSYAACECSITRADVAADGTVIIHYSFVSNATDPIPAMFVTAQAYQGMEKLSITDESTTDGTHYSKYFSAEPGQTVELYTTFRLNNDSEDVTVYLTYPTTAEIYTKQVYSLKG